MRRRVHQPKLDAPTRGEPRRGRGGEARVGGLRGVGLVPVRDRRLLVARALAHHLPFGAPFFFLFFFVLVSVALLLVFRNSLFRDPNTVCLPPTLVPPPNLAVLYDLGTYKRRLHAFLSPADLNPPVPILSPPASHSHVRTPSLSRTTTATSASATCTACGWRPRRWPCWRTLTLRA